MSRQRGLELLAKAFHGVAPAEQDWPMLMDAANQALVTPALHRALAAAQIPADAADFLALISTRNDERNTKLRAMAADATAALNAAGVTPVLLKGMAVWATCHPDADAYPRMMSDVDLLVPPQDAGAAVEGLLAHGFQVLQRTPGDSSHVIAELWRDGEVGALDLHQRPPGAPGLTALFDPETDTVEAAWPGAVRAPTPAQQIYLTCLHDMFHDGGFWRGGFDVRHLCDIADLTRSKTGVDWQALTGLLRTRLVRNAIHSQLIAAHHIAGADIPVEILNRPIPRLHYRRHYAQSVHPRLYFALAVLGMGLEVFNLHQYGPSVAGGQWAGRRPGAARLGGRLARVQRLARGDKAEPHPNRL